MPASRPPIGPTVCVSPRPDVHSGTVSLKCGVESPESRPRGAKSKVQRPGSRAGHESPRPETPPRSPRLKIPGVRGGAGDGVRARDDGDDPVADPFALDDTRHLLRAPSVRRRICPDEARAG